MVSKGDARPVWYSLSRKGGGGGGSAASSPLSLRTRPPPPRPNTVLLRASAPALGSPAALPGCRSRIALPDRPGFRGKRGQPFPGGWGDTEVTALGTPRQAGGCGAGKRPLRE